MPARDDFSPTVKDALAKRVGHKCSCPSCGMATSGPSSESELGVSNLGVAAHITAASPGGPRYDPTMSGAERRSINNAIWLCQNHAKAIDDDEARFNPKLLAAWRRRAEQIASGVVFSPEDFFDEEDKVEGAPRWKWRNTLYYQHELTSDRLLVPHTVMLRFITTQDLHRRIQAFMTDVGATSSWGTLGSHDARLLLYELALNAFRHAKSATVRLSSSETSVGTVSDGGRFGLIDLGGIDGRGGKAALESFQERAKGALAVSYRYHNQLNEWHISDLVGDDGQANPCGVRINSAKDRLVSPEDAIRLYGCDEIHIYPPERFSFSDTALLSEEVKVSLPGRPLVIHGVDPVSGLGNYIAKKMPGIRFVY